MSLRILLGQKCRARDIATLLATLDSRDTSYTLFSTKRFVAFPQIHPHSTSWAYDFVYLPDKAQMAQALKRQIPYFSDTKLSIYKALYHALKSAVYACIALCAKLTTKATTHREIAIIRTDAIGDYMLFRNFLPLFARHYGALTLIGNSAYEDLLAFDRAYIKEFIPLNPKRFQKDLRYRFRILKTLQSYRFKILINPIFSRDMLSESLAAFLNADYKVASVGDCANISLAHKAHYDAHYHELVPARSDVMFEFYRNAEFATALLPHTTLPSYALSLPHTECALPSPYVVFFIGASAEFRKWSLEHFYEVGLWHIARGFSIVICGGQEDRESGAQLATRLTQAIATQNLSHLQAINLCGDTSLSALARVVYNGNHLLSNETSCVHIACAIRHDISIYAVYNGNHLYRFTPYPQGIGGKYYGIYHPTIAKNLVAYGIISNFLQQTSRLDINLITPQMVIHTIESTLPIRGGDKTTALITLWVICALLSARFRFYHTQSEAI